ncbi:MAG: exodeoxyribonuclease VII small subunit [Puniceicoccales bacterium]|jgi:exodeoxyribonuclease VII small subunit|nr:exodeoxyribonuclease VII small subunit [Puniceicoccales bacterium]
MNNTELKPDTFDMALGELEQIVESLERGESTLEELMRKYERGMKLHAHCQQVLGAIELRVEQLRKTTGGEVEFLPLPDAT